MENLGGADPSLNQIQTFGLSRTLSDALVILTFIKSAAVRGTLCTTILAILYAPPFFVIELIDATLVDRYEDELDDGNYLQIHSLPSYSFCLSNLSEKKYGFIPMERGIYQDNGFYIYEII